ncbi:MAG: small conductance mechanosensitive channel [Rhodothermales bacterium]|jgi:small conductance mechanosensitive channel
MQDASAFLDTLLATLGAFAPKVVGVVFLFITTVWVSKKIGRQVEKVVAEKLDPTLARFFGSLSRYGVLTMGILACLRIFGIETTSFAALIGAAGLAVGLAMQGTLSNFSAGMMLIVFRPFDVGDWVSVGGVTGSVAGISLFNTEIDTVDNQRIIVPNNSVFGNTITNVNFHDTRRVAVEVGTEYSADIPAAQEVMLKAISNMEGVLPEPAPVVYLTGLGSSSIDWSVRVWVNTPDFWDVKERVTKAVKKALDDANIGIPFPQMDVHLDKVEA